MIDPRKGNDGGRRSRSRMISTKLRVAGSTGSLRTGAVVRKVTVWPACVSTGMRADESGGRKKGVTSGGVSGGNVKGGMRRGGWMPRGLTPNADACCGTRASVIGSCSSSNSLAIVCGPTIPSAFSWFDFWNSTTRAWVRGPKSPSTARGASLRTWKFSTSWTARTSAPLLPCLISRPMRVLRSRPRRAPAVVRHRGGPEGARSTPFFEQTQRGRVCGIRHTTP